MLSYLILVLLALTITPVGTFLWPQPGGFFGLSALKLGDYSRCPPLGSWYRVIAALKLGGVRHSDWSTYLAVGSPQMDRVLSSSTTLRGVCPVSLVPLGKGYCQPSCGGVTALPMFHWAKATINPPL